MEKTTPIRLHYLEAYSNKISQSDKYVVISDIHSDANKLEEVFNAINTKIDPDFVIIAGDVIDNMLDTRNEQVKQILNYEASKNEIFIGLGNHDVFGKNEIPVDNSSFFDDLRKKGIVVFQNTTEGIPLENGSIIYGLDMDNEWYKNRETSEQVEKKLMNYEFNPDKYNILIFHSPRGVLNNQGKIAFSHHLENIPDHFITGHMHAGLIPYEMQHFIKDNRGVIGPYNIVFPKNSYGIYNDENKSVLISDGITKIHFSNGGIFIAPLLENIFIPDIYIIKTIPVNSMNNIKKQLVKIRTTVIK